MIRLRAIIIGLLATVALGIVTPICDLHWIGALLGASYMPVGALFLFFLFIVVLNTILKLLKISLTSQELLLIYAMMIVANGIPSFGYSLYAIGITAAPFYFASPENRYAEVLHKLIPDWLHPKNMDSIKYFYEGLPKGMNIPYADWIGPLFIWTLLVLAFYLVMFSLAVIVRKQWAENEKLIFPLATVPTDMVKEDKPSLIPPFFKDRFMWIGFIIPLIIVSLRGLHFYFPVVPLFLRDSYWIGLTEPPWSSLGGLSLRVIISILGFAYLIPTSLSFSIWFFYFIGQLQIVIGAILGYPMPVVRGWYTREFLAHQTAGGMIIYAILLFWVMRLELKKIFLNIWHRKTTLDRQEKNSYLFAFVGLLVGFLFICFWAMAAGAKIWSVALWTIVFFLTVIVITRAVSEFGLFFVQYNSFPLEMVTPITGSTAMGEKGISTLNMLNRIFPAEGRVLLMPFFLNNLKMADVANIKKKILNIAMWIGIIVMIITSYIVILNISYRYGAENLQQRWWLSRYPKECTWDATMSYITSPTPASLPGILWMVTGAGVTTFLFCMRRLFLWWPFHPIGYLVSGGGTAHRLWFMMLLGWLLKVLILRFGGIKVYQRLKPLFIGLIIGEFVTIGIWVVIDLIFGTRGNFLVWL